MTETLLSRVLADSSLRGREAIDEAPLEDLEHLIAEGPAAGLHPSRLRVALIRRAHMLHEITPRTMPDKAQLLSMAAAAFPAVLAKRAERYRGRVALPTVEEGLAALELKACDVVTDGAVILVERRVRLHDSTHHLPMDHTLFFVTRLLGHCGVLLEDPELKVLPIAEGPPGKLWRGFAGKGVGAVWRRERLSERATNMRCGLHPDGRTPGPALIGEETRTIIALA